MTPAEAAAVAAPHQLSVRDVMRPPATTVEPGAHLAAAAYLMKRRHDSALVVMADDGSGRPVGVVTEADITQAVADRRDLEQTRISDLMNRPPLTVEAGVGIDEATATMLEASVHHLLVVEGTRLVGIVDMADLCRALTAPRAGVR
jgi:acetoin utilization protein AcuB